MDPGDRAPPASRPTSAAGSVATSRGQLEHLVHRHDHPATGRGGIRAALCRSGAGPAPSHGRYRRLVNAPPAALLDARYRVGSMIARGGMSTVYRGMDTRLDRPVAIKIMDARLAADPAFRTRFEREARSAARIDHPAVVDVYDQGDHHGPDGPVAVPGHGAGRGRHAARRAAGPRRARRAGRVRGAGPVLAGLAEAHRLGPGAPRRQAGERADQRGRRGQGGRLRAGRGGRAGRGQPRRHDHGHGRVPVARSRSPPARRTPAATSTPPACCSTSCSPAQPPYTRRHRDLGGLPARELRRAGPVAIAGDVPPELDELVARATRRDPAARPGRRRASCWPSCAGSPSSSRCRGWRSRYRPRRRPRTSTPPPGSASRTPRPVHPPHAVVPAGPRSGRRRPARAAPGRCRARSTRPRRRRGRAAPAPAARAAAAGGCSPSGSPSSLVLALAVGAAAWWLGSGRWTAVPTVVGVEATVAAAPARRTPTWSRVAVEKPDDGAAEGVVTAADRPPEVDVAARAAPSRSPCPPASPGCPTIAAGHPRRRRRGPPSATPASSPRGSGAPSTATPRPEGTVMRTDPPAASRVASGSPRGRSCSAGARSPSRSGCRVIGRSFDDAEARLREARPGGRGAARRRRLRSAAAAGWSTRTTAPARWSTAGTTIVLETLPF